MNALDRFAEQRRDRDDLDLVGEFDGLGFDRIGYEQLLDRRAWTTPTEVAS